LEADVKYTVNLIDNGENVMADPIESDSPIPVPVEGELLLLPRQRGKVVIEKRRFTYVADGVTVDLMCKPLVGQS
jgi:hypothetical protein